MHSKGFRRHVSRYAQLVVKANGKENKSIEVEEMDSKTPGTLSLLSHNVSV